MLIGLQLGGPILSFGWVVIFVAAILISPFGFMTYEFRIKKTPQSPYFDVPSGSIGVPLSNPHKYQVFKGTLDMKLADFRYIEPFYLRFRAKRSRNIACVNVFGTSQPDTFKLAIQ